MSSLRARLEQHQVTVYFAVVAFAVVVALRVPGTEALGSAINPSLAVMLFVTFLQVPLADLRRAFVHGRFLLALLMANFVVIPVLVAVLVPFLPGDAMVRLGVLLVLLTPCIDYVVTFSHIGRADARLLLAATPILLLLQMVLLPFHLGAFLGEAATTLVRMGPFIHAFVWLIAIPLAMAAVFQAAAARIPAMSRVSAGLGLLPVPATATVLFVVVAAVMPQIGAAAEAALRVVPFYLVFALVAPVIGWVVARVARLPVPASRAVAFSAATRNSLVVLPLALAVPGALPVLPAIIVTQTMVELLASVLYMRLIPRLGASRINE